MRQSDDLSLHGEAIDDEAARRYLRGAQMTARVMREQMRRVEAVGVAPEVVTTAMLGVAIERLVQTRAPEEAAAWLIGIARHLAGGRDTAGSA